jgi:predicted metal-dependent phosphoesterase TrpH
MKFDMHIHSSFSRDGSASPKEIAARCKQLGLDGFAISDHNAIQGSLEAVQIGRELGLIVVKAVEVSTAKGHVLAYGISENIPRGLTIPETIEKIHGAGGIAVAAHPVRFRSGIGLDATGQHKFDAIEVLNGGNSRRSNRLASRLAEGLGSPVTAGSDAHRIDEVGRCFIEVDSVTGEDDVVQAISDSRARASGRSRSTKQGIIYSIETVIESARVGFRRI